MNFLNNKKMKTTIFTLAFAVSVLFSGSTAQAKPANIIAQPADDDVAAVFKEFRNGKNVTYIDLPQTLINIRFQTAGNQAAAALADRIDGQQILYFDKADQKTKDRLNNRISELEMKGYKSMVKANEDNQKVRILIKGNEQEVQGLVFYATDKEDCVFINIDGHIPPSDIDAVVKSITK